MEQKPKPDLSFPLDLTSEILLRLSARSVARFRCVSKLWSSIITNSYFINSFETRNSTLQPSLVLCFRKDDGKLAVSLISQQQNSNKIYSSSQPIDRYHMKYREEFSYYTAPESVHGLICLQESGKPVLWNPIMRQFLTLPKPYMSSNNITIFLGYDPIEGKHKVVCTPYLRYCCNVFQVLTLESAQESWRAVKTNHMNHSAFETSGRCIKGVIYYIAYTNMAYDGFIIMSFDVRSEKFYMIQLPSDIHRVINYKGRLAYIDKSSERRLWVLEDAEKHKWKSQFFLVPLSHHDPSLRTDFNLTGFTHVVRNCCRRFEFKEIAEDEYGLDNGVRNKHKYANLHSFPNHI